MLKRARLCLLWMVPVGLGTSPAAAGPGALGETPLPQVASIAPALLTPDRVGSSQAGALWADSLRREAQGDFQGAALVGEQLIELVPDNVHTHWRIARNYMQAVDALPLHDREGRRWAVEQSRRWAKRGRQLDPSCGECCLYDFGATARLAALSGGRRALGLVREAARTLEACLASPPGWVDSPWSDERANLFHGAGVFYRALPDSRWISLLAGVRGDKERSVRLARKAVAIAPERVDYAVGLGAALLCHGTLRDREDEVSEGRRVLERVGALPDHLPTDAVDRRRAAALLRDPRRACRDTRDGAVQLD